MSNQQHGMEKQANPLLRLLTKFLTKAAPVAKAGKVPIVQAGKKIGGKAGTAVSRGAKRASAPKLFNEITKPAAPAVKDTSKGLFTRDGAFSWKQTGKTSAASAATAGAAGTAGAGLSTMNNGKDPNQGMSQGDMKLNPALADRMMGVERPKKDAPAAAGTSWTDKLKGMEPAQRMAILGILGLGSGVAGSRIYGSMTGNQNWKRDLAAGGTAAGLAALGGEAVLSKESSQEARMDGMYQGYKRD